MTKQEKRNIHDFKGKVFITQYYYMFCSNNINILCLSITVIINIDIY